MPDASQPPPTRGAPWTWRTGLVLLLVAACSWFARDSLDRRAHLPSAPSSPSQGWVTLDPDSLYQMRRVERALDEAGSIASHDGRLNYPIGSAIPWPPYYTRFLATTLAPFAPAGGGSSEAAVERHGWIERRVASLPLLFGVLTSLLAALAARKLAGDVAALGAGTYHALCLASIAYSKAGNGDHHAWVTLLAGGLVVVLTMALAHGAHRRPSAGWLWGGALGVIAGVLLGSWVASLMYIVEVQLVLAWLILRNGREHLPGLPALGFAFHLVALLVALPAVLESPWRAANPWQAVNLSWFHPTFLGLGALIFLPLPCIGRRTGLRRTYPWLVLTLLVGAGALLLGLDAPAARGVREGFQWMSKVNQFMAGISESRPLLGPRAGTRALTELGFGLLALPLVWGALVWSGRKSPRAEWLPFLICIPLRLLQAGRQARFGDALTLPMAVLLGAGLAWLAAYLISKQRRQMRWASLLFVGFLASVAHPNVLASLAEQVRGQRAPQHQRDGAARVAAREACEWLRRSDTHKALHRGSVLANWSWGHCIEWVAERPSLATNFGTYVGEEGFRAAPRFLLSEDGPEAWALLREHGVAFVLVTSLLPKTLSSQTSAAGPEFRARFLQDGPDGTDIRPGWFETIGARLLRGGRAQVPGNPLETGAPLERLRLVFVSSARDPGLVFPGERSQPGPAAFLWEHVPGALLRARGAPGTLLSVQLVVRFPRSQYRIPFTHSAVADRDGLATLRVPYATESPTGNGLVPDGLASFTFGARTEPLRIPDQAVVEGQSIELTDGW